MKEDYYLHKDQTNKVSFSLPDGWTPEHVVRPEEETGTETPPVEQMLRDALTRAESALPSKVSVSAKKAAVIVDDATRPTPVAAILPVLLEYLETKGYTRSNVSIVIALGTHAPLTDEQLDARLGARVRSACPVVQHNAWAKDLVPVKVPEDGRTVRINPVVANADLRVGVSSILPHPMAGFGGGPKIVFPGVSDFDSIKVHHPKNVLHPNAAIGVTKGNPFHEEIASVARAVGLHLSINCVYNAASQLTAIRAGSPDVAFKEATDICFQKLGHRFTDKVDVTIASTFPHTHGNQLFKGLMPASVVTRDGGAVLLFSPLVEPIPAEFLNSIRRIREASGNKPAEYIRGVLTRGEAFLPDKPMDYNMAMTNVFIRPPQRVLLVSNEVSKDDAALMGMECVSTINAALSELARAFPRARVAIFPAAGLIIPVMS
jgi:lactate racemase